MSFGPAVGAALAYCGGGILALAAALAWMRGAAAARHSGSWRQSPGRWPAWLAVAGLTAAWLGAALPRLGERVVPLSSWSATRGSEGVYLYAGTEVDAATLHIFDAQGHGTYELSVRGGNNAPWETLANVETKDYFSWEVRPLGRRVAALHLEASAAHGAIGEVVLVAADGTRVPLRARAAGGAKGVERLVDEQDTWRPSPTYRSQSYFDEIYYVRTAHEIRDRTTIYETTHPPLGKLLVLASIRWFGDHPFGWRALGVAAGAVMIPALYALGACLFRSRAVGLLAALLLALDGMHFAQSRLATGDAYLGPAVVLAYALLARAGIGSARPLRASAWLAAAALAFGAAAAIKWVGVYACIGFWALLAARAWRELRPRRHAADSHPAPARRLGWGRWVAIAALALALPAALYLASYIPLADNPYMRGRGLRGVLEEQRHMFTYHHDLTEDHPYGSPWWEWPLLARPLFLAAGKNMPEGLSIGLVDLGNPAVWWPGALAILVLTWRAISRRERAAGVAATAFFAQYLPWIAITRVTFVYHFYTALPFAILALARLLAPALERRGFRRWTAHALLAAAAVFFALFYPVLAGVPVAREYADALRWLPRWEF